MATIASATVAGCDQGHQDDEPTVGSVPVTLLAANIGPTTSLAANADIELSFDRFLDPLTMNRQGFVLTDATGTQVATSEIVYDPVLREVSIHIPGGLVVGQPYTLLLEQAPFGVNAGGLRATDGAPLPAPLTIGFQTTATVTLPPPQTASFCNDVLPVFQRSCSLSSCHGAPTPGGDPVHTGTGTSYPAEGLALSTGPWVETTAIGRVANEANSGPSEGTANNYPGLFGVDMAVVAPNNPDKSWLLYKCLLSPVAPPTTTPTTGTDCTGATLPVSPITYTIASTPASDDERARLGQQIQGNVMPYPYFGADGGYSLTASQPLTLDELERLRLWILDGAVVTDCSVCPQ